MSVDHHTAELITYYDDAAGERTGLTAAELGSWSAATAALLVAECGLRPGHRAGVLLPPHWQTAAVLLGSWAAGLEVSFRGWGAAGLGDAGPELDVTFVERRRVGSWLEHLPAARHRFVLDLAPAGAGAADVPEDCRDFLPAVRAHRGAAPPPHRASVTDPATPDGTTFGEYDAVAAEVARSRGIRRGDRVLVDAAGSEEPLIWLLAPLSAGASIVLCANLDRSRLDDRIAAEGVTRVF
ncbi:TIGR03089 family protein [Actinoplanes oblitus]|uniref:TIGR03089 family protein n=1 Tax=Actinoplanes oblitus TaxID=3040509 RepID=A0ABY8WMP2_9ACTN|nr:TIGR03089 family protein [Actinoplanes oblitus]WIM99161.1 TIGR03089 family protein [Actinoplanes oblitus]